jgi:hypothetical protein
MSYSEKLASWFKETFCKISSTDSKIVVYTVWLLYCFAAFIIASHHESWFDEGQAWLLARDAGPFELLSYLPFEGSPPLWHYLLMIPAKLGMPYVFIQIMSLSTMCFGIYLILGKAPFPIGVKVLIPFNYFFLFQYSVVARNYCLILPIIILIAILYNSRYAKPFRYIITLVAFSWISSHTAVLAGGLVVSDLIIYFREWRTPEVSHKQYMTKLVSVFAVNTLTLAFMCWPAGNINLRNPVQFSFSGFIFHNGLMLTQAIYGDVLLSLLILFVIVKYSHSTRHGIITFTTLAFLALLYGFVYTNLWHAGIILCWIVFILWIASSGQKLWPAGLSASVIAITLVQANGTWTTIKNDWQYSYSGAYAASMAIKEIAPKTSSIEAYGFASHAVLPYFDHGTLTFSNSPKPWHEFYTWSSRSIAPSPPAKIDGSDELILVSCFHPGTSVIPAEAIKPDGYDIVGVYPGWTFWKTGVYENYCYYLFVKSREKTPATK